MNYHFFIDEKFVNDFVVDAEKINNQQKYIVVSSATLKFVNRTEVVHFSNYENELNDIVKAITENDKVFIHWFSSPMMSVIERFPSKTKIYLMFYGADFLESNFPPGKNQILDEFLFDPITREFQKSQNYVKTKAFLKERMRKAKSSGNIKNILHTRIQNIGLKQMWIKGRLFQREWQIRKLFLERITAICHWNEFDVELLEELYKVKLQQHYFVYNVGIEELKSNENQTKTTKCTIWLGNSDTPTNNHLDALAKLEHLKEEDLEIICPLNYGDKEYGDLVEKYGKKQFGDKFIALRNYMDRDEYYRLMDSVNVAIMPHNRGQAGGNIIAFLKKGVKVYMKPQSSIYKLFKSFGIPVFALDEFFTSSIEGLKKDLPKEQIEKSLEALNATIGNEEKRIEALKKILLDE